MTRKLYPYQSKAAWHLYHHKRQALFAGLGSGKTTVVLMVLERLLAECVIRNILVVAPIAVCKSVWRQEAQEWNRTRNLTFSLVVGTIKQRIKALQTDADIYLINYESLSWLINLEDRQKFDVLVLDESTMVQGYNSVRFAGRGKRRNPKYEKDPDNQPVWLPPVKGLKKIVGLFDRVYLMTGTPKPGEYMGLWSQMYCLDQGRQLGKTITDFRSRYYTRYGPEFYQIKLRSKKAEKEIQDKLKPLCYRISQKEVAAVLPKVTQRTYYVDLDRKTRKIYDEIENDFFIELENRPITVENVAILSNKLQQICQGSIYDDNRNVLKIHSLKIDMLDALIGDLGDRRLLVIYTFRHDIDSLVRYRNAPVLRSSMADRKFNHLVDNWNKGKYPIIYGHPASMGHGLNLQGGGFDIVFFGLTWSLDKYQQSIGRLRRSGQPNETVFVHRIACRNTIEDGIMLPRLKQRNESQRDFLNAFTRYRNDAARKLSSKSG